MKTTLFNHERCTDNALCLVVWASQTSVLFSCKPEKLKNLEVKKNFKLNHQHFQKNMTYKMAYHQIVYIYMIEYIYFFCYFFKYIQTVSLVKYKIFLIKHLCILLH